MFIESHPFNDILLVVPESVYVAEGCTYNSEVTVEYVYERVKDMYRSFLRDIGLSDESLRKIEIVVAPSVGSFRNYYGGCQAGFEAYGELTDYYHYMLQKTALLIGSRIREGIISDNKRIELHLDLTHGVNYMPALAYRALINLSEILAWRYDVVLRVYNSEPVLAEQASGTYRLIHVVEEKKASPRAPSYIFRDKIMGLKVSYRGLGETKPEELGRELNSRLKKLFSETNLRYKDLNMFLASISNGLPLLLYNKHPSGDKLEEVIKGVLEVYKEYTSIETKSSDDNPKIIIRHQAGFHEDYSLLIETYLYALVTGIEGSRTDVSLREIKQVVSNGIFSKNDKVVATISRDIYEIENRLKKYSGPLKDYIPLYKLFNGDERDCLEELGQQDRFTRNFLAHSGLESCIVEIKKAGSNIGDTILRYRWHLEELIYKASVKGLKGIR